MKWKTWGMVYREDVKDWHPWFAWHPVTVTVDSREKTIWLETIDRIANEATWSTPGGVIWEYRLRG